MSKYLLPNYKFISSLSEVNITPYKGVTREVEHIYYLFLLEDYFTI